MIFIINNIYMTKSLLALTEDTGSSEGHTPNKKDALDLIESPMKPLIEAIPVAKTLKKYN